MTTKWKILPNNYKYEEEKEIIPDAINWKDWFPRRIIDVFFSSKNINKKIKELYNIMEKNKINFKLPETFKELEETLKNRSAILFLKDNIWNITWIWSCVIYNKNTIITAAHNVFHIKNKDEIYIIDSNWEKLNIKNLYISKVNDLSVITFKESKVTSKYKKLKISEKINKDKQDLILAWYRWDKPSYTLKSPYWFNIDIFNTDGLKISNSWNNKNEITVNWFWEPWDSWSGVYSFDSDWNFSLIWVFRSISIRNNEKKSSITPVSSILNINKENNNWDNIF